MNYRFVWKWKKMLKSFFEYSYLRIYFKAYGFIVIMAAAAVIAFFSCLPLKNFDLIVWKKLFYMFAPAIDDSENLKVVIMSIDDAAYKKINNYALRKYGCSLNKEISRWPAELHAEAVRVLAACGVSAIGFDILFYDEYKTKPDKLKIIADSGVLTIFGYDKINELDALSFFKENALNAGFVNLKVFDAFGSKYEKMAWQIEYFDEFNRDSFAFALFKTNPDYTAVLEKFGRNNRDSFSPGIVFPYNIKNFNYSDLFNITDDEMKNLHRKLKGKIVIIGNFMSDNDMHNSVSGVRRGSVLLASTLQTLYFDIRNTPVVSSYLSNIAILLLFSFLILFFRKTSFLVSFTYLIVFFIIYGLFTVYLYAYTGLILNYCFFGIYMILCWMAFYIIKKCIVERFKKTSSFYEDIVWICKNTFFLYDELAITIVVCSLRVTRDELKQIMPLLIKSGIIFKYSLYRRCPDKFAALSEIISRYLTCEKSACYTNELKRLTLELMIEIINNDPFDGFIFNDFYYTLKNNSNNFLEDENEINKMIVKKDLNWLKEYLTKLKTALEGCS